MDNICQFCNVEDDGEDICVAPLTADDSIVSCCECIGEALNLAAERHGETILDG